MPFIVGVGRSGTTLLRLMLDAHPAMAIPPETHFVPALIETFERPRVSPELALEAIVSYPRSGWPDSGVEKEEMLKRLRSLRRLNSPDAVRSFYALYAARHGKTRFGDKTPRYVTRLNRIGRALPEAHFIHVIRDGRDVALSMNRRLVELRDSQPVPVRRLAKRWRRRVLNARANELVSDRYIEVRYEDLVADTEETLRRVCVFLALEYDPVMLRYHETAAVRMEEMNRVRERAGRQTLSGEERMKAHALTSTPPQTGRLAVWKTEMSAKDQKEFEEAAGDLLIELGYETAS
jgi:hypothetical protein